MKKYLSNKIFWQSFLSLLSVSIFIVLAVGSTSEEQYVTHEDLGDGRILKTTKISGNNSLDDREETIIGKGDGYQRWNGPVFIYVYSEEEEYTEEVNMIAGYRHGRSKIVHKDYSVDYICYDMGDVIDCTKAEQITGEEISAFQVLRDEYPWFRFKLNVYGFNDEYLEPFMNSLETIIGEFGEDPLEFDNYYQDAVDSLSGTPYDSLIILNSVLALVRGGEEMKSDEFRMASIDRYRSNSETTYDIINATYPGYLKSMIEFEITDQDFQKFCHLTDSLMDEDDALFGTLDQEHIFFTDSVDIRLYRAISYILNYEDTTSNALKSMRIRSMFNERNDFRDIYRYGKSLIMESIDSTTQYVSSAVLYFMLLKLDNGDIIKKSVNEAWISKLGVVSIPTVTTLFAASNSSTSVTLEGHVIEDGGAAVGSRGMAWAEFYNPTINDDSKTYGSGLGSFEVSLDNLVEGKTYYARAFAENSAGTAYGNCIKFTAGEAVGINEPELFIQEFTAFPNPASNFATFSFNVESSENMSLIILNMKGQAVYHHDFGRVLPGENRIELDLSSLPNGIYSCQLNNNGMTRSNCKILITH